VAEVPGDRPLVVTCGASVRELASSPVRDSHLPLLASTGSAAAVAMGVAGHMTGGRRHRGRWLAAVCRGRELNRVPARQRHLPFSRIPNGPSFATATADESAALTTVWRSRKPERVSGTAEEIKEYRRRLRHRRWHAEHGNLRSGKAANWHCSTREYSAIRAMANMKVPWPVVTFGERP